MKRKASKTDFELFLADVSKHLKEHCGIGLKETFLLDVLATVVLTLVCLKPGAVWYEVVIGSFTLVVIANFIFYLISIFRSTGD